jgi:hypothetical protein
VIRTCVFARNTATRQYVNFDENAPDFALARTNKRTGLNGYYLLPAFQNPVEKLLKIGYNKLLFCHISIILLRWRMYETDEDHSFRQRNSDEVV